MKRIILLFAGLLAINVYAQDASQLRIYLNPGHGSWGPDDRPMATIPYPATLETGRPDTLRILRIEHKPVENACHWRTAHR